MLKRKKIKLIILGDVIIIDDGKFCKVIIVVLLGNVMEWFDFGVYGFVVYVLGKVFFFGVDFSVQMIVVLVMFFVFFLICLFGGLFFGMFGDKYGCQKILVIMIVIMLISIFCIGLIFFYVMIGIWVLILLLLCKMVQGFLVGGEYIGVLIFVVEYLLDCKCGFMGSWLDFGFIVGFVLGVGVVVLILMIVGEENFLEWGWCILFFIVLLLGIIGFYLCYVLEEMLVFQQYVDKLEQGDCEGLQDGLKVFFKEIVIKYWCSLLLCIGLVIVINVIYYMLFIYMLSYLLYNLYYFEDYGVLIIIVIMIGMLFVQLVMGLLSDCFG